MTTVFLTLPGNLDRLTATNVRQGFGRSAIVATFVKKQLQKQWLAKMRATGKLPEISRLQRQCAEAGRLVELTIFVYRRHDLDEDNFWTACNKLLLDPLQAPHCDPPVIYSDRKSNLRWRYEFVRVKTKEECHVEMLWRMSEERCGQTTRARYRKELKAQTRMEI